jgi:hypothetical protein
MNREDIVRMAKEAGMESFNICIELDDFAKLVAQHERERINANIKELERDAARYREVREWDFCGYDHALISPESVDREVDNARGQE